MTDADVSATLAGQVRDAHGNNRPLYITGGGSKRQVLGRDCNATPLAVGEHRGIIDYEPAELVITARAGTPLAQIQDTLAGAGQELPFEPPLYDGSATLGGTLACNLSGPGRPWRGSARDTLLGMQLVSGTGELLEFGGRVMKNVAGYDLVRLQAGALGTLGVISAASLKVLPVPETTLTLRQELSAGQALERMNRLAATPKPLTGACWTDGALYLRLAGAASAVGHTAQLWGGDVLADSAARAFWEDLREQRLPVFASGGPLWRLSVKSTAAVTGRGNDTVIDWGGAQRWITTGEEPGNLFALAAQGDGHAQLFRGGDRSGEVRSPLSDVQRRLQREVKARFDPAGILNPGRLYPWM